MKPVQKAARPSCRVSRQTHEFRLTRLNLQTGNLNIGHPDDSIKTTVFFELVLWISQQLFLHHIQYMFAHTYGLLIYVLVVSK